MEEKEEDDDYELKALENCTSMHAIVPMFSDDVQFSAVICSTNTIQWFVGLVG
jgi:hypothetical protein